MFRHPNIRGALMALLAFAVFATHDSIVKALGGAYSPFQIVFFSVLLSFPLTTIMLMRDTTAGTLLPRHPWWTAARSVAVVVTAVSAFYAFSNLPLATVYAILFASPLLITILSIPMLGETVRLRRWVAVIAGLCGVLVVLRPGQTDFTLGHAAALLAALGGSIASIIVRKIGREERSVVMLLYPMIANCIIMGALLPLVYEPMPIKDLGLVALVSLCAFVATLCIISAYRQGEAVIVAPMQYSQIIWATAFGALFFDEIPDTGTFLGAGIVILSGVYIVLREGRSDVSATTPVLRTKSRAETGTHPRVGSLLKKSKPEDPSE